MNAISNARWVAVSQSAKILSQVANIFILARVLPPSDYGLMAMATVVTNLALLLRDQGTAAALIQREKLDQQMITTVFWFNVMLGVVIALAIMVFSPAIAHYFKKTELIPILCCLAVVFPLASSATSHQALMERESRFRRLALIDIAASAVAMIAAIIAALMGAGVYSLVIQAVTMSLLTNIQIWLYSDWRPSGKPSLMQFKSILPFTGHMTGFQLITYFFRNADSLVIGRILGTAALGVYSMAYKVMLLPVQNITWAVSRALYPVMSRQQSDLAQMGRVYLQTIAVIAFMTAPLMAGVFALRELFVGVAFGPQWASVAQLLVWLAPVGFLQSISSIAGTVFMAQGKTKLLMGIALASAIIHVAAYLWGTQWGIDGVARYYFLVSLLTVIPTIILAGRLVQCSLFDILHALWRPLLISL
ncbi:MAG TPA: lipopolysaccharide biosynthesis protein, partial [Methylophilaceae bacterium]